MMNGLKVITCCAERWNSKCTTMRTPDVLRLVARKTVDAILKCALCVGNTFDLLVMYFLRRNISLFMLLYLLRSMK